MRYKNYIFLIFSLFIFCIFSNVVYGYNLKLEARYVGNSSDTSFQPLSFFLSAKASQKSQDQYNTYSECKDSSGYVVSSSKSVSSAHKTSTIKTCSDLFDADKNQPTTANYISRSYNFYAYDVLTTKYWTSDSKTSANHITDPYIATSYLTYPGLISYNNTSYITSGGNARAYIAIAGNPSLNTSKIHNIEGEKVKNKFKILNGINIEELVIQSGDLQSIENTIGNITPDSEGKVYIRFSAVNWTKWGSYIERSSYGVTKPTTNEYMDTAWKFYTVTQMTGTNSRWSPLTRGCSAWKGSNDTDGWCDDSNAPYSTLNEYDNILQIPYNNRDRKVYVRHINAETGQLIPNAGNTSSANGIPVSSGSISYNPYGLSSQEYYSISPTQSITLKKTSLNSVNNRKLNYVGYKKSTDKNQNSAISRLVGLSGYTGTSTTATVAVSNIPDYTFVDFYYTLEPAIPALDLKGRLLFTSQDSEYKESTSSDETDYIPSGKSLLPYISNAYPYMLDNLKYKNEDATIPVTYSTYHYEYWKETYTWKKVDNDIDPKTGKPEVIDGKDYTWEHTGYSYNDNHYIVLNQNNGAYTYYDDGRVNYKEYTHTITTSHTVYVPVRYYKITNIDMWRMTNATLKDYNSNVGGKLFSDGKDEYNVSTSSSYYDRSQAYIVSPTYNSSASCSDDAASRSDMEHNANCIVTTNVYNSYANIDSAKQIVQATSLTNVAQSVTDGPSITSKTINLVDATTVTSDYTANTKYFVAPGKIVTKTGYSDNNNMSILLTNLSDFDTSINIPDDRVNGIRNPWASISYSKYTITDGSGGNIDADYELNGNLNPDKDLNNVSDNYNVSDDAKKPNNKVNILTPVALTYPTVTTQAFVNHTDINTTAIIQKNADFTITPQVTTDGAGYGVDTYEFVRNFYITLDFDIVEAKIIDSSGKVKQNIGTVSSGSVIKIPKGYILKAKSTNDVGSTAVGQLKNSIHIVVSAYNTPQTLENDVAYNAANYIDEDSNKKYLDGGFRQASYYGRNDVKNDAYHMAYFDSNTTNLSRIYDFKITDCADVDFKDVFRNLAIDGKINSITGKVYYAGINKWDMTSGVSENEIKLRTDLGKATLITPLRILPLGPYKHDPTTYLNAPKLGYRFSFDLKTTGYLPSGNNSYRQIQITPSYYYISKDGKTFNKNIELYYKNSINKYIPLNGSNYTIYFTPNDGYRNTYNENETPVLDSMSTKLEGLNIGTDTGTVILNTKMMSTSNDRFIQAWYGDFKLPNFTIAIDKGIKDISNESIKKDGYIGVVFTIKCLDYENGKLVRTTSYNQNDKVATNQNNTSEWDYEGYLGFRSPGNDATNITLQLEKGTWYIDNAVYQNIKGTVVLYDTDQRAALDFD